MTLDIVVAAEQLLMLVSIILWYRQGMPIPRFLLLCAIAAFPGCAYQLQGARNPLKELGIQKIYVEGFRNSTYRPGIEHLFTTAMVREIGRAKAFDLVNSADQADAVLTGVVTAADSAPGSTKQLDVGTKSRRGHRI